MLKEKLLGLMKMKKKKAGKKLDLELDHLLDKLVEEAVKDPEKEKEILEALEDIFKKKGGKINACSRNSRNLRGGLLSSAEIRLQP